MNIRRVNDLMDALALVVTHRGARVVVEDKQGRNYNIKRVYTIAGGTIIVISAKEKSDVLRG